MRASNNLNYDVGRQKLVKLRNFKLKAALKQVKSR